MTIIIADGRGALWQWDTGRRLRVGSGVEQIHYQNRALGGSADVDVGADGTGRYDMLHIKVVDGYQMQLLHTRSQNASNAFGVMQQDVAAANAPINFKVDATALFEPTNATGYATCVKISGYTNENVPAGTHIKLYGKRVKS